MKLLVLPHVLHSRHRERGALGELVKDLAEFFGLVPSVDFAN